MGIIADIQSEELPSGLSLSMRFILGKMKIAIMPKARAATIFIQSIVEDLSIFSGPK